MASKRKYIDKNNQKIYMEELREIVNTIFVVDICNSTRKKECVEGRMVFARILRGIGVTHVAIAEFLNKEHCSIVHYMSNFDNYFSDKALNRKYMECRDAFFEKRPADTLYYERDRIAELEAKYKRFKSILDIMNDRTPVGKEELLEKRIALFLNGI